VDDGHFNLCKFYNSPNCVEDAPISFTVSRNKDLADLSMVQIGAIWYDFNNDVRSFMCF
jgi:hypothetical protein